MRALVLGMLSLSLVTVAPAQQAAPGPKLKFLVAGGARIYVSGGSSQARTVTQAELAPAKAQFATPRDLVRLAAEHDRVITY